MEDPLRRRGLGPARRHCRQAGLSTIMAVAEESDAGDAGAGFGRATGALPPDLVAACGAVDRLLGATVETAAAGLVLSEIIILLAGVTSRYVFRNPLIWSDELASPLFLWLSMLGAVIALGRGV